MDFSASLTRSLRIYTQSYPQDSADQPDTVHSVYSAVLNGLQ
jgi:hypothetical protein